MTLLRADTVVTGDALLRPGWIETDGPRFVAVTGAAPMEPNRTVDLGNRVIVPGFVDTHVHGGGGEGFGRDVAAARTAIGLHRRFGTTSIVASLVTAAPGALLTQVGVLAELVEDGELAGVHFEGPWLSASRAGAHEVPMLRDPDPRELDRLLAAGRGAVRMITLAPERPGALEVIARCAAAGVVAAVGHTDATYEQTRSAVDAGATVGTHLFNAMRPLHHREPGPALALLEDPRVTVELVVDGVHLHPALYRLAAAVAGPERIALVTDAMAAVGLGDGDYGLGALRVIVEQGVARLAGSSTIAGSTATMDELFRFAVRHGRAPGNQALLDAVRQTSTQPARALGLRDVGSLRAGGFADLVVLNDDLTVHAVMRRGRWRDDGPPESLRASA